MGRRSNADSRRDQIVWALYDCLAESGPESVTIKDIAARANLRAGLIHYYFKGKDDVYISLAEAFKEKYQRLIEQKTNEKKPGRGKIIDMVDLLVDEFIFNRKLNRVFYSLVVYSMDRAELKRKLRLILDFYRKEIESLMREAGAGDIAEQASITLTGFVEGLAIQVLVDPDAVSTETVRSALNRLVDTFFSTVRS